MLGGDHTRVSTVKLALPKVFMLIRWAKKQHDGNSDEFDIKKVLEGLKFCLRPTLLDPQIFVDIASKTGIFTTEERLRIMQYPYET